MRQSSCGIIITTLTLAAIGFTGCAARTVKHVPVTPTRAVSLTLPATIPAGTPIEVRTNEAIKGESTTEGRTYQAEVARDVTAEKGGAFIPKGSSAQIVVPKVSEGGRVRGTELELGLRSIILNGRETTVSNDGVRKAEGLGASKRTAEMLGGGALLGTIVGAATGEAKAAAIGAPVGAAAGAAIQVLTKENEVNIPAETLLTFRLDRPLSLNPPPSP